MATGTVAVFMFDLAGSACFGVRDGGFCFIGSPMCRFAGLTENGLSPHSTNTIKLNVRSPSGSRRLSA